MFCAVNDTENSCLMESHHQRGTFIIPENHLTWNPQQISTVTVYMLLHLTIISKCFFSALKCYFCLRASCRRVISNDKINSDGFYCKQIDTWVMLDWFWLDFCCISLSSCWSTENWIKTKNFVKLFKGPLLLKWKCEPENFISGRFWW